MTCIIRPFQKDDSAAILDLTVKAFNLQSSIDARIEAALGGADWREPKRTAVRRELEAAPDGCGVAELDGVVVGYITTAVAVETSRGRVANLAVDPSCQGQGVGRRLIEWALQHFRDCGLHQAKIETLVSNAAGAHLYPAMGFKEVARQVHYALKL